MSYNDHWCSLLLKVSAMGTNALLRPCPHVQDGPPHHCWVNLGYLPGDVCLQLILGGRAKAVDLGFEEAPEAEVEGGEVGGARRPLSAPQAPPANHSVPKLVVQIPHVSIRAMHRGTNRGILILIISQI